MAANTMPKSLHTVTVLMQFARHLAKMQGSTDAHAMVALAARILYDGETMPDDYGLKMTAARKLAAEFNRGRI